MLKHRRADIFNYVYEQAPAGGWDVVNVISGEVLQTFDTEELALAATLAQIAGESIRERMWAAPTRTIELR